MEFWARIASSTFTKFWKVKVAKWQKFAEVFQELRGGLGGGGWGYVGPCVWGMGIGKFGVIGDWVFGDWGE